MWHTMENRFYWKKNLIYFSKISENNDKLCVYCKTVRCVCNKKHYIYQVVFWIFLKRIEVFSCVFRGTRVLSYNSNKSPRQF